MITTNSLPKCRCFQLRTICRSQQLSFAGFFVIQTMVRSGGTIKKTVVPPGRKIITFFSVSKICEAHCTFNKVNMVWNSHPGHFNRDVLYYCVDRELKSCKDSQEVTRLLGELERVRERNKQLEDELSQTTTSNQ